jgi:hypothetical protein
MRSFISLIDTTREDTMKNEDFIKQLHILTRNLKEEGKRNGGERMQKIKKKKGRLRRYGPVGSTQSETYFQ